MIRAEIFRARKNDESFKITGQVTTLTSNTIVAQKHDYIVDDQ